MGCKDCSKCEGSCDKKDEGFEIEIGRDEETKDFLVWVHDGGKAPSKLILDALKKVVEYLEFGEEKGSC